MSKQYANGIWFKTIETQYGQIHQANIKLEDFIASANEVVNQEGYVTVQFKKSREGDKFYSEFQMLDSSNRSNNNPPPQNNQGSRSNYPNNSGGNRGYQGNSNNNSGGNRNQGNNKNQGNRY